MNILLMYLVKNTFIHDIVDDDGVHDEWETKSCPGRLEEAVCMEKLEHDSECVDVPHCCTTITKPSCDTAGAMLHHHCRAVSYEFHGIPDCVPCANGLTFVATSMDVQS